MILDVDNAQAKTQDVVVSKKLQEQWMWEYHDSAHLQWMYKTFEDFVNRRKKDLQ
jgi:hypothetical protein